MLTDEEIRRWYEASKIIGVVTIPVSQDAFNNLCERIFEDGHGFASRVGAYSITKDNPYMTDAVHVFGMGGYVNIITLN